MKSSSFLLAALASAIFCTTASDLFANPRTPESAGSSFLVAADDLTGFHVGGYYRYQSREINHGWNNLTQDNIAFHVGYDLLPFFSIYGLVGTVDNDLEYSFSEADRAIVAGGGVWLNMLDHDLLTTLSLETRIRLSASAQYTVASPEIGGVDYDYSDFYANLTFSIINEINGNKNIFPEAVGLFFGPVYENLDSDEFEMTGDKVGMIFGLDIIVTPRVSLSASYETYGAGDDAVSFSLDCRL